jgi:GcrA cell cycle regulator
MPSDFEWTDVAVVRLRSLWAEGHSTAEIGRRLGVSKNAVVGKAHRLDLPDRPSPIRRDAVAKARPDPRPPSNLPRLPSETPTRVPGATALAPAARSDRPPGNPLPPSVPPLGTHIIPCCWPIGYPGKPGFCFCEERSVPGRPYCGEHCMIAYVRQRKAA